MKQKAFFIIFKGLSMKQITQIFLEGKSRTLNKLIFAYLNLNSIRNKFEFLATQVKDKIDISMTSESKIDESFPKGNSLMEGFSIPYRLDRYSKGGGSCYM